MGACVLQMEKDNVPEHIVEHLKNFDAAIIVPDKQNTLSQGRRLIDACQKAGVRCITLISLVGIENANVQAAKDLLELENHLKKVGGQDWAIVRTAVLQQGLFLEQLDIKRSKKLRLPVNKDSKCAMLNLHDISEFIVQSMVQHQQGKSVLGGKRIYRLTGLEALTGPQVAEMITKVINTKVEFEQISREEAKKCLSQLMLSEEYQRFILDEFELINSGHMAYVSQDEQKEIHKEPERLQKFIKDYKMRFHQ